MPVLIVCACAWFVLVLGSGDHGSHARGSPASQAAGWLLMLAAMMAPLLVGPVRHVRDRSFVRRRVRAVTLFLVGYTAVWTAAGVGLPAVSEATRGAPLAGWAGRRGVRVAGVAREAALPAPRARPPRAAGPRPGGGRRAFRFGVTHAVRCVGTWWALMLLSLLVPYRQLVVMAAVTVWLAVERLGRPTPVRWRLHVPRAAARAAAAHLRQRPRPATR